MTHTTTSNNQGTNLQYMQQSTMMSELTSTNNIQQPLVCTDPRFRAGRKLIQRGLVHLGALKIFSVLLNRAEEEFGPSSLEFAAVDYEYGYALFLDNTREEIESGKGSFAQEGSSDKAANLKSTNLDSQETELSENELNVEIALEHMVKSCNILYEYVEATNKQTNSLSESENGASDRLYMSWASEQLSRALIGIGYVLSYQGKYPDALNSYFNALPIRTELLDRSKSHSQEVNDRFKAHRLLVEVYILIVEEILKCPNNEDIKTESNDVLIKKEEKIEMAKIYYEKAREELQEA